MTAIRSLCVYCGSSDRGPEGHATEATRLGKLLADKSIRLIYGGGRIGLMGILAKTVLDAGGEVIGIIPKFLDEREVGFVEATRLEIVDSMHERKSMMAELSDGFVILPGGLGTMDEFFEILTWRQLGLHDKPIVVVESDGYWTPAKALVEHIVAHNYAASTTRDLIHFVPRVDDIFTILESAPEPRVKVEPEKL